MIPVRFDSAWASGSTIKEVVCEECHQPYRYLMSRSTDALHASIAGIAAEPASRLTQSADRRLQQVLEVDCDPVPCPNCGRFQAAMIGRARGVIGRDFDPVRRRLGLVLLIAGAITAMTSFSVMMEMAEQLPPVLAIVPVVLMTASALAIAAGALVIRRRNQRLREFDPNMEELRDARIGLGRGHQRELNEAAPASNDDSA